MLMKVSKITSNIIHVNFDTKKELAETFCRFQEHYESPEFRGKVFTLGQYREWYCGYYGAWTYYTDWSGFNIPDWALVPFKEGLFDPLSEKEQILADMFRYRTGKFYVIGTFGELQEALDHEICHAFYYLDEGYRGRIDELISRMREQTSGWQGLEQFLIDKGYASGMIDDEMQAYLACNVPHLKQKYGLVKIPDIYKEFEELREKYFIKHDIGEW